MGGSKQHASMAVDQTGGTSPAMITLCEEAAQRLHGRLREGVDLCLADDQSCISFSLSPVLTFNLHRTSTHSLH